MNGTDDPISVTAARDLWLRAKAETGKAYAPYSGFYVAAALRLDGGGVVTGVNVENSSYPQGICAERAAVARAVSEGHQAFDAIAIAVDKEVAAFPCGGCLQVLLEFSPQAVVIAGHHADSLICEEVRFLLPRGFRLNATP